MSFFLSSLAPSPALLRERCNALSCAHGRTLTLEEAAELAACRQEALRATGRVEFGEGPLPLLAEAFADSPGIQREEWPAALAELQELFYTAKNLSRDTLTDQEAVTLLHELFHGPAHGSLDALTDLLPDGIRLFLNTGRLTDPANAENEEDSYD